jgi:hypothetical protein
MRPKERDPSFLFTAGLAATGGLLAIAFSVGFPLWARMHGERVWPACSLFAGWGVAALAGAYASLRTYFDSGDPARPPRGGVRIALVAMQDAASVEQNRRRFDSTKRAA